VRAQREVEEHGRSVVRATGKCTDPDHFHAWIRLPNQFQIRDIAEKAKAAQARKKRMLRDQQTRRRDDPRRRA
jgi:REP element-mobilizing transposase RayT